MQSKITIEIDFQNGTPYIKVFSITSSTDMRDKALALFFEKLATQSMWCKVEQVSCGGNTEGISYNNWHITPISPDQLSREADKMKNIAING